MDLWVREARLFKYGSGTGTNFSQLRGERRAAVGRRPVVGPDDVPEDRRPRRRRDQVGRHHAPRREDGRASTSTTPTSRRSSTGRSSRSRRSPRSSPARRTARPRARTRRVEGVPRARPGRRAARFDRDEEPALCARRIAEARSAATSRELRRSASIALAQQGVHAASTFPDYDTDWDGEAYYTVSGQNSNNSVRIPNEFMRRRRGRRRRGTSLRRTDGKVAPRRVTARELWDQIAYAAWACADPGVQFDTTINEWHTCPADGRINASNPCSEYMFLDDTACNLASLNLVDVLRRRRRAVRHRGLPPRRSASGRWCSRSRVLMAQFPSQDDRPAVLRLPHARPRLREPRHAAHGAGHPVRLATTGLRDHGRAHRDPDRRLLRDQSAEMAARARAVPRLPRRTARPCCA